MLESRAALCRTYGTLDLYVHLPSAEALGYPLPSHFVGLLFASAR